MQSSKSSKAPSSNSPRHRNLGRRDDLGSYSDPDEAVRFHSFPISRENVNRLGSSNLTAQRSNSRSPKALSSITEHSISPKLDRREFKPVSSKSMEYQPSPTRTATQHGNIYRLAPVPASASMHAPSSPFSLPSSPSSLPSELPHHSAYLLRPGPPTVDDPDVSCGQASLTLFTCLFKSFKRNSSTNETSKDRRALKKKAKARRVPTAEFLVEKASKRPNRRGYYRFTDEEMEEHNVTRNQLMSWRENRVRSHLFHGHEGYQGSHQMTSQGVPVTFLIPPQ